MIQWIRESLLTFFHLWFHAGHAQEPSPNDALAIVFMGVRQIGEVFSRLVDAGIR